MGTRVDQNIQTKKTRVHVLIRTLRLRIHGHTCRSEHLDYEHTGTRVDQNIQIKNTWVHVLIGTFRLRRHGYTC